MTVEGKYRISGQKGKQYYRVKIGNVVGNINRFSGKLVLVESDIASDLQASKYASEAESDKVSQDSSPSSSNNNIFNPLLTIL